MSIIGRLLKPKPYQALIDTYCSRIDFYEDQATYEATFFAVPEEPRNLFAANWVRYEFENGGFGQLFANSTGMLVPEGLIGFRAIGMPRAAAVVEEATSIFGPSYPRDRKARASSRGHPEATQAVEGYLAFSRTLPEEMGLLADMFGLLLRKEGGGFHKAANRYAEDWLRARL